MRKRIVSLVLLAALLAVAVPAAAQVPGPGGPYNSAFTIQNLGSEEVSCTFSLYGSSATAEYTSDQFNVPGDGSYFVFVGNLSVDSGQYSAVVSCSGDVAAVANMTDASSAASYSGFRTNEPGSPLYAPGIYKSYYGFTSNVVVQNTTDGEIDIDLEIYEPGSTTPITFSEDDVPANTAVSFDQGDLTSNGLYSAKIVATGDVAAVVNIWNSAGQLYSYNPFAAGEVTVYAPVLMNGYYDFNTALTVQNLGDDPTDVRVSYSDGSSSTATIDEGTSHLFYTPNEGVPDNWLGSAEIESLDGEPIVALVNEESANNRAASYSGFTGGSETVNAPIVLKGYYDYSTSITCQNIGSGSTDITITYSDVSATSTTESDVGVNQTVLFYQPNVSGLADGFNGSAVITADEDIVCIVNEDQVDNAASEDWLLSYNAIGQ